MPDITEQDVAPKFATPEAADAFLEENPDTVKAGDTGINVAARKLFDAFAEDATSKFVRENLREGIPLQVEPSDDQIGNVSPWIRFQTERRQGMDAQQKYLESKFGPGKVRRAKDADEFIVEVTDKDTGKVRDIRLNEDQITLSDLGAVAAHTPEIALSLLAAAGAGGIGGAMAGGGKLIGLLGKAIKSPVGKLLSGSIGFKTGEAAQQIETELEDTGFANVRQLLEETGREVPGQAGMDLLTAGVFKTASLAKRGLQGGLGAWKTDIQREGLSEAKRLAGKYGVPEIRYTGAQASGQPLAIYLEAYATAKPQATSTVQEFNKVQQGQIKALADAITGGAGTDEATGDALLQFLKQNQQQKLAALGDVMKTMSERERASLFNHLGKVGDVGEGLLATSEAGGKLRAAVQKELSDRKVTIRDAYNSAYSLPGATDPVVPTDAIAKKIDDLLQRFPTTEKLQWLEAYKSEMAPNEAYKDIVQRRSDLWNRIESAPGDRSTKDYVFEQLSNEMTSTLDDAAKNIMDPGFKKAIQTANTLYKTKELPLYQKGLRDVLLNPGVPGSPENIQILDRFSQSSDLFRRLVDTVGPNHPAVAQAKANVIDGLLQRSGRTAINPQWVDPNKFVQELTDLASNKNTREMFKDIFGGRAETLLKEAKALGVMEGSLSKQDALDLLTTGTSHSKGRLERFLAAQKQVDTVEAKRLLTGSVDDIQPEALINRYAERLTESELRTLMAKVSTESPALMASLRDKQVEQILGKAGDYRGWNQSKIMKVLDDPKWRGKYEAILGPDKMADIEGFAKALGPIEHFDKTAEGTGMLIKGESIGEFAKVFQISPEGKGKPLMHRAMAVVPGWLGWKVLAKGLTSEGFGKWAAKDFPAGTQNIVRNVLISEPFLEDIATSGASPEVIRDSVAAMQKWYSRVSAPPTANKEETRTKSRFVTPREADEFLDK